MKYKPINPYLLERREYYLNNTEAFVEEVFGHIIWEKQIDILESLKENKYTSIGSCHNAGKTFTLGLAAWWFSILFYPAIVAIINPTLRQSERQVFSEILDLHEGAKIDVGGQPGNRRTQDIKFSNTSNIHLVPVGRSVKAFEKSHGLHSRSGNILLLIDEASAIPNIIIDSLMGSMSSRGARMLMAGNPVRTEGRFYESFSSPLYHNIHIGIDDVLQSEKAQSLPSLITKEFGDEIRTLYGEDSYEYKTKVLGIFDTENTKTFFSHKTYLEALQRKEPKRLPDKPNNAGISTRLYENLKRWEEEVILGIDTSRTGRDANVASLRRGFKAIIEYSQSDRNMSALAGAIKSIIRNNPDIQRVHVDGVGEGAALCDFLKDDPTIAHLIVPIVSNKVARDTRRFANTRAEGMSHYRDWMMYGAFAGDKRFGDCTTFGYSEDANERLLIESKRSMNYKNIKSPDCTDATMLTFCEPQGQHTQIRTDFKVMKA